MVAAQTTYFYTCIHVHDYVVHTSAATVSCP